MYTMYSYSCTMYYNYNKLLIYNIFGLIFANDKNGVHLYADFFSLKQWSKLKKSEIKFKTK